MSDNGPEFKHVRSFPHHHKANGKAESAVKITRNLFKKALRDSRDPRLVLLEYKNTTVETIGSSPAQRVVPRRTKTLIPTASTLLRPEVVEGVEKKIELKRRKAKSYYDRSAHPLPQLEVGQGDRVGKLEPLLNSYQTDPIW